MEIIKNKAQSGRNTHTPQKKPIVVQYKKQANKAKIRSVMPENVQECLEAIFQMFPNIINLMLNCKDIYA